mgnify:CR=1 FL=1
MTEKNHKAWYVVHTKPKQEARALENLQNQGYVCFLPMMQVQKLRRQKVQWVTEPMFSRYLFIQLDDQTQNWGPIRSTLGVSKLVYFGSQPAKVDPQLIDLLQSREEALPAETIFQPGDAVVITAGPFAGIEAVYQTSDPERRSMILLEILSKRVTMRIDAGQLRKVG